MITSLSACCLQAFRVFLIKGDSMEILYRYVGTYLVDNTLELQCA